MTIRTDHNDAKLHMIEPWVVSSPRLLRLLLDVVFAATALGTFAQLFDPDVLFHVIWVVLTLQAFLFGLRPTAIRIGIAGLLLLGYFNLATLAIGGTRIAALDLAEWPLMVVIAVIVAVMADRLAVTSRHFAELYRQASDRLLTAQEGERRRLGMDLHDGVGQTLAALVLTLDAAEADLWGGAPAAATTGAPAQPRGLAAIRRAQELAAIALDDTRDVAYRLRPDRLVETGLVAATERLAAAVGARVRVVAEPELKTPGLLDPEDEMNVYRIVQEAVNNAVRHAAASRITVEYRRTERELIASVSDDGLGFDPASASQVGLGLAGMRERAVVLRAELSLRSRPGRGTTVSIAVPVEAGRATEPVRVRARAARVGQ